MFIQRSGKCKLVVGADLGNTHRFKSYSQNEIHSIIMPISFTFGPQFGLKHTSLVASLPIELIFILLKSV